MKTYLKLFMSLIVAMLTISMTSCVSDGLTESGNEVVGKEIATLAEQASSVMETISDVKALKETADGHEAELNGAIRSLESHVSYLSSSSSWEDATLATLAEQKKLAAVVGPILAQTDAASATKTTLNSLDANAKAWLGKNMGAYWSASLAEAQTNASLAVLRNRMKTLQLQVEGLASDVEAGLKKDEKPEELESLAKSVAENIEDAEELSATVSALVSDLEETYRTAVQTASQDPASYDNKSVNAMNRAAALALAANDVTLQSLAERVDACNTRMDAIASRLGELEDKMEDLATLLGLIQSVTLMPDNSSDYASAYYQLDPDDRTDDGCMKRIHEGTISLSYLIRPASAAAALAEESLWNNGLKVIGYYAQAITKAAVVPFDLTVEDVEADATVGLVTVTVDNAFDSEDFYMKKTGAKVALSITSGKTDITSKFVEIVPVDASGRKYLEAMSFAKDEVEVKEGEGLNLTTLIITPQDAYDMSLVWTSENDEIASVSETGRVTGTGVGTTTITVTSKGTDEWGKTLSATCSVKVNPAIELKGPAYVERDKTAELTLDFPPTMNLDSKKWWTSDESKATVSDDGIVTGVADTYNQYSYGYGDIIVYCKINDEVVVEHTMKVVVPQPKKVKFNNYEDDVQEVTMKVDESISFAGTIEPESYNFRIFYESTAGVVGWIDSESGAINRSTVTGPVTVTAKVFEKDKHHYFAPGKSLSRSVVVNVEPYWVESVSLPANMTLTLNTPPATLTATFTSDRDGKQPSNTNLTWESSNSDVVSINAKTGEMTAKAEGTVQITAKTESGAAANSAIKTATCLVTVKAPVAAVNVGDYYFSDGTWGSDPSGKTVIGVIFSNANAVGADPILMRDYPQCSNGLVVGLVEYTDQDFGSVSNQNGHGYYAALGYDANSIVSTEKTNGYGNTLAHRELNASKPDYCKFFNASNGVVATHTAKVPTPSKSSSWYIPSYKEMSLLNDNRTTVNASLSASGGTPIAEPYMYEDSWDDNRGSDWYWTSTIKGDWYQSAGTYDHFKFPFDIYKKGWTTSQQNSAKCKVRVILAF